jgi:hypothetical protein
MKSPKKASTKKAGTTPSKAGSSKAKAKTPPAKDSKPLNNRLIDDEDDDLDLDLGVDEFDAGFDDEEFDEDEY